MPFADAEKAKNQVEQLRRMLAEEHGGASGGHQLSYELDDLS